MLVKVQLDKTDMQEDNQQPHPSNNGQANQPASQGQMQQPVVIVNGQPSLSTNVQPSNGANDSGSTQSNKTKRFLKFILIAAAAIPVVFIVGYILIFAVSGQIKMSKLQNAADNKLQYLEQMLAVDNKVTEARGTVDGDALTANSDPGRSTFAYLSFENKSSLSEIETKLAGAMAKEGFKRDGGDTTPYYKFTSPAYAGYRLDDANRIVMRYSNNQDAVKITYELDKYYDCPKEYVCERTEKTKSSEKIYDIRSFASLPVTKVSVNYANKSNYQTQL